MAGHTGYGKNRGVAVGITFWGGGKWEVGNWGVCTLGKQRSPLFLDNFETERSLSVSDLISETMWSFRRFEILDRLQIYICSFSLI